MRRNEGKRKESSAIKIRSVQAASLYRVNNGYKFVIKRKKEDGHCEKEYKEPYLDFGHVIIHESLFAKYVRKHGGVVNGRGESLDFLLLKFDYGVDVDDFNMEDIKPSRTSEELRNYYYENDATVTWKTYDSKTGKEIKGKEKTITYKMLLRTTGKAKEGECLFIKKNLHKKILDYITMGLWDKMPDEKGAKIVEMSAYAPLITATAIGYIKIPMDNIFVLEDQESICNKKAITVKAENVSHIRKERDYSAFEEYINRHGLTFYKKTERENPELKYINRTKGDLERHGINADLCPRKDVKYSKKECCCDRGEEASEITNILWDGMGLIDSSIFPENTEGFIYCRSHFFKSCLFKGSIQEYFKNHYGEGYDKAYITDMTGRKMKVTDIKVIVTENSLKWVKFLELMSKGGTMEDGFEYYKKIMETDGEMFAIVKTAHKSKYGDLQRSSFQMNNTLLTVDEDDLREIASKSIEYCNKLKTDDEAFLKYLEITGTDGYSINNVLIDLYRLNYNFKYTEWFKKKRREKINKLKNEQLRLGKLFQVGDNLTICGNPIAMLMKVTGQNCLEENCFKQFDDRIQCCTTRFQEGEKLAGFRSPHNSFNNIVYLENMYPEAIKTYFPDLGQNVIIINGIGTDVQNRLNGQDLDTDSIYATNQRCIVELARKAYAEYPTIINGIGKERNVEYDKKMSSYSKMDCAISASQYNVGYASDLAQLALSYWFDDGCKNTELEDVFVICSVLAQVAIDSAKRSFGIDVGKELARIAKLTCMKHDPKYPRFYADVQKCKNKKKKGKKLEIKEDDVGFFECPMDVIYRIIDKEVLDLRKQKELNTNTHYGVRTIFEYNANKADVNRKQYKKVVDIVKQYDEAVKDLDKTKDSYHEKRQNEFEACIDKLRNTTIKKGAMYTLIAYAFTSGNEKLRDSTLTVLYDKDKDMFLECFKKTEKSSQKT